MNLSNTSKGVVLSSVGIVVLSPDGLLIRMADLDLWTMMFLRGFFMGLTMLVFSLVLTPRQPHKPFLQIDLPAWGIVALMVVNSFFFVAAIQTTSVAHTLIIVGATPVVAALLGLWLLKERVTQSTWITIGIVVIGLLFIVTDHTNSTLEGDLYALAACLIWSFNFIFARKSKVKNMIPAMSVSGFLIALASYPLASLESVTAYQLWISLLLGVFVGSAFSMLTLAPRYMPSAQVAVFMPLETVFGSLLVWWFLNEYPGMISIIAGVVMISAIMINSYLQIRNDSIRNRIDDKV